MKLKLIDINRLLKNQYKKQTNKYWGLLKKIIATPAMLLTAYDNLKNNAPSKQTRVVLLNSTKLQYIKNTANALKLGTFTFKTTQDIVVLKNKELKQSVTINNIIQEAIYMVLKLIYEYDFLNCSQGTWPGQNPHINLKTIKNTWKQPSWWLKITLQNQFDATLQRKVLFNIIRSKITDQSLENILNILLNNKILNLNFETLLNKEIQNAQLSILLLNIYLHKLDLYIIKQKKEIALNHKHQSINKLKTSILHKINYTRYTTNLLIAISGPKWLALNIRFNVHQFIKSNLHLNIPQISTELKYAKLNWIFYLGVRILIKKEKIPNNQHSRTTDSLQIQAPLSNILNKLQTLGITQFGGKPRRLSSIITQTDEKIIRWFSKFANKLITYYRCCDNFSIIKKYVNYHLRWSCYHTLANKFKTTITKIIKKYDKNLIIQKKTRTLVYFPTVQKIKKMNIEFLTKTQLLNPI